MMNHIKKYSNNKGASILITMMVLLLLSSLIVCNSVLSVKNNSTMVRNQIYNTQAFEASEAGIEYGYAYLKENYLSIIQDKIENNGQGNGYIDTHIYSLLKAINNDNHTFYDIEYTNEKINDYSTLEIKSTGSADNGLIKRKISIKIARTPFSKITPNASLITLGNVQLGGNTYIENYETSINIVSGGSVNLSGSASTQALQNISSDKKSIDNDIKEKSSLYSTLSKDEFFYTQFNFPKSFVENSADTVFNFENNENISSYLTTLTNKRQSIWINQHSGTASLTGNITIGSSENPVFLVINGDFKASGNTEFYGILYITQDWINSGGGNLKIHGSVIVEGDMKSTGTPNINYDKDIINKTLSIASFNKIPGSWHDY